MKTTASGVSAPAADQTGAGPATAPSAGAAKETNLLRAFSFSIYATQALVVSYIPLYFLDRGFSAAQIGILYSTGPFISVFANLITGTASDKYRTIKKLLTVLLLGQLVMISLLFTTNSFILVGLIMLAFYFCQTPMNPLSDSLILLSSQYTGRPYALVRIFGSLGSAVCAYAFGLLLKQTGTSAAPFVGMAMIAVSIGFSFLLKDYQGALKKMDFSGFLKLLRKPDTALFFLLVLVISIAHRMYEGFLAVTLRQMGASDSLVGLASMISGFSEIPVLFLLGKYGHKFKELPLLAIASLMYAVRFFLIGKITSPVWVLPLQAMHSVSFGIYFATAVRYLSGIIPDEYRSSGQAVYAVIWSGFAGIISGTVGGAIYDHYGKGAFFHMAAGLALAACAGFLGKHFLRRK
ncbi:MFS transporter [Paenibacillus humicola]|uniref:MFS transporter n=1 Tax=Paenibacillus humicola TaxID=3110540 RepID=UPI00237C27AF|nr:MFS transporter [Paenibacillus humicola]